MMATALRPYRAVFRVRFQLLLQYRAAALAGFGTQCWWGAIKVMVLTAFLSGAVSSPMTLRQTIDYIWLGQALLTMLPWSADPEIARMVRTGDVSYERLRPLDTYAFWYARAMARRTATPLLRAIPMVLAAGLLLPALGLGQWGLAAPPDIQAAGLFALAVVLLVALSSALATLMDVVVVATLSDRGIAIFAAPLTIVLSGSLIPLPLFPEWMQTFLRYQPFAGLQDTPFRIYTGHLTSSAAAFALGRQAIWVVVLVALGKVAMDRVMARLQAQGG
jgi:ABC-2 type transport system permease protein